MKIPFIIHTDGVQETGFNSEILFGNGQLTLNLQELIGDNKSQVIITMSDYQFSTQDVLNSKTIPLLHVVCSNGSSDIWSLGENPDVSSERTLSLICGDGTRKENFSDINLRLDCASLIQHSKFFLISKPSATDYLVNTTSPTPSSVFLDATDKDGIEVVMGTPIAKVFQDAFDKAEGQALSSASLRLSFQYLSKVYFNRNQIGKPILTNTQATSRYMSNEFFNADLVFDGTVAPTYSATMIYRGDGIILRTKKYKISAVGYKNNFVVGANCLDDLLNKVLTNPLICYAVPFPTSMATLTGVIELQGI